MPSLSNKPKLDFIYKKDAVKPIPWNQFLAETKGYACDWLNPSKGGKYKIT